MAWRRALWVLWFANFITAVGMMAMVPFLTYFVADIGITAPEERNRWAGILVGAAPITAALLGPIWGAIGDRTGQKTMIVRALAAIIVFVGSMWFVHDPRVMLGLRLLQGAFSGYVPPSITLVSILAPPGQQGYVAGRMHSAVPAGAVGGYLLGGWISHAGELRMIFPICAVLALIGLIPVLLFVHDDRETRAASAAPAMPVLRRLFHDLAHVAGIPRLFRLLTCLVIVRALLSTSDPNFAHYVEELGGDERTAGLVMSGQSLMLLFFAGVWGKTSDTRGPEWSFVVCAVGAGVAFVAQALATEVTHVVVGRLMTGIFLAGIFPSGYGMAARETPPERRGSAMGVVFLVLALSHALGAMFGGELLNVLGFRRLLNLTGVAVLVLAVATWISLRRRT